LQECFDACEGEVSAAIVGGVVRGRQPASEAAAPQHLDACVTFALGRGTRNPDVALELDRVEGFEHLCSIGNDDA
jgi:hypothetical protein